MKKFMVSAALATFGFAGGVHAAGTSNGPGCGWGQIVFKGQSGLFAHTAAATTNGTSANQWFALTSGTAGCDPDTVVSNEFQRKVFVASNMDNLSQDMAQGRGEHLDALASLLYISEQDKPGFFSLTQAQLPVLMEAAHEGAPGMLSALDTAMLADPALSKYVR